MASNSMKSKNPYSGCRKVDVVKTIDTSTQDPSKNQGGIEVCAIDCWNHVANDVSGTLQAKPNGGQSLNYINPILTYGYQGCGDYTPSDVGKSLLASDDVTTSDLTIANYYVRRLTPLEYCRLQGFPDWWMNIPPITDMTDEAVAFWNDVRRTQSKIKDTKYKHMNVARLVRWYNKLDSDDAQYKMWGNGVAMPCVLYVMQGMARCLEYGV